MHTPSLLRLLLRSLAACAVLFAAACATTQQQRERLPFHVAVAPVEVVTDLSLAAKAGEPTELQIGLDRDRVIERLEQAVATTFAKVTVLPRPTGDEPAGARATGWITAAQEAGADLLLVAELRYHPAVQSELNDRFWLNLPLFAIGGPFCWFVADRTYYCQSRLDGELFDVTAAGASRRRTLDPSSRVVRLPARGAEASLNFLQRADGVGSYLLSVVCPAGLLATESAAIPGALDEAIVDQLCAQMATDMTDRETEIREADLVDFFPRNVRVVGGPSQRALEGEFVLRLGAANELGRLRYRLGGGGAYQDASWIQPAANTDPADRRTYAFRIAVGGTGSEFVQVEVEQLDQALTRRTFTFLVPRAGSA